MLSFSHAALFPLHCLHEWHHRSNYLVQTAIGFGVLGHRNVPMLHTKKRQSPNTNPYAGFIEPLQEKTCHQMQEGSICSLHTHPEIFSHECCFSTWLPSKNKGLQYYHVATSKASSPSDSHFRCEKLDEKWRPLFCVLFALQLKSVKML